VDVARHEDVRWVLLVQMQAQYGATLRLLCEENNENPEYICRHAASPSP
jgi:hypothetical protein